MTLVRLGEWLLAILIGAGLVFGAQHLMGQQAEPEVSEPAASDTAVPSEGNETPSRKAENAPPQVIDAPQAKTIVQQTLDAVGVRPSAVATGAYRLIGPGRAPGDVLPLLSFTCPQTQPCDRVFLALEETLTAQGFQFLEPKTGDQERRALHRAVSQKGHPILAVRAYPPGPRLSVVVGDVGVEPALLDRLLKLDQDVTYAISTNGRHSKQVAKRLTEEGREIIAHLPLESSGKGLEGQRFLSVDMSPELIEKETLRFLGQVPGAIGADGHLGGLFSRSRTHMKAVLRVLARRGHFFLDQRADQASVAGEAARELGVRAVSRTHRIEGDTDVEAKLRAVEVALVLEGDAVISISPSPQILDALVPWLEGLRQRKIHIMRLSEVVL